METVHHELQAHKVKKNAIEAKVREVGEKSKERKVWVVRPDVKVIPWRLSWKVEELTTMSRHNMAWRECVDVGRGYTQVDGLVERRECGGPFRNVPCMLYIYCYCVLLIVHSIS